MKVQRELYADSQRSQVAMILKKLAHAEWKAERPEAGAHFREAYEILRDEAGGPEGWAYEYGKTFLRWCDETCPRIDPLAELPKLSAWADALEQRPSVRRSTVDDIRERFRDYLGGKRGEKRSNEPPSWLLG